MHPVEFIILMIVNIVIGFIVLNTVGFELTTMKGREYFVFLLVPFWLPLSILAVVGIILYLVFGFLVISLRSAVSPSYRNQLGSGEEIEEV